MAEAAEAARFTSGPVGALSATLSSRRAFVPRRRKQQWPSRSESSRPGVGACPDGARGTGEELRSGGRSQVRREGAQGRGLAAGRAAGPPGRVPGRGRARRSVRAASEGSAVPGRGVTAGPAGTRRIRSPSWREARPARGREPRPHCSPARPPGLRVGWGDCNPQASPGSARRPGVVVFAQLSLPAGEGGRGGGSASSASRVWRGHLPLSRTARRPPQRRAAMALEEPERAFSGLVLPASWHLHHRRLADA